jgi:hypothetical protein
MNVSPTMSCVLESLHGAEQRVFDALIISRHAFIAVCLPWNQLTVHESLLQMRRFQRFASLAYLHSAGDVIRFSSG